MNSIDSLPVTNIFARGSRRIVHRFVLLVLAASIGFSVNVADGQLLVGNSALPSSGLDQAWDFDPLTTAATPQWAGSLADVRLLKAATAAQRGFGTLERSPTAQPQR